MPFAITRHPDRLIVEYQFFSAYDLQPRIRFTFALDGSESRNTVMIGHASVEHRSTVAWSGDTLIIRTTVPAPAGPDGRLRAAELRQALSLDSTGVLTVEATRFAATGAVAGTTRTTYTRR